jgi:hypothetical protein
MPAEDFADFTAGIQDATDSLGDFSDALGDAGEAAEEAGDFGDLGGGGGGGGEADARLLGLATGKSAGSPIQDIAGILLGIAAVGLPVGVGTVVTKAVGSKL